MDESRRLQAIFLLKVWSVSHTINYPLDSARLYWVWHTKLLGQRSLAGASIDRCPPIPHRAVGFGQGCARTRGRSRMRDDPKLVLGHRERVSDRRHPPGGGSDPPPVSWERHLPWFEPREAEMETPETRAVSEENTRLYARKPDSAGGRRARQEYTCEHCGRSFRAKPVHDHRGVCSRRFCSKRCAGAHRTAAAAAARMSLPDRPHVSREGSVPERPADLMSTTKPLTPGQSAKVRSYIFGLLRAQIPCAHRVVMGELNAPLSTAEERPATGRRNSLPRRGSRTDAGTGRAPWHARSPNSWRVPRRVGLKGQPGCLRQALAGGFRLRLWASR